MQQQIGLNARVSRFAFLQVTRSLVRVGGNVAATLVESFLAAEGAGAYQINDATMIALGDGARLDHVRLMEDGREAFNISTLKAVLGRDATYSVFNMTTGGAVSRYQALLRFDGRPVVPVGIAFNECRRLHARPLRVSALRPAPRERRPAPGWRSGPG